jgi:hypothetical protein
MNLSASSGLPWACAIQAWAARTWLDLPRPVALIRPLRARSDLDQLDNIGLCSGDITAARRARCAGEVGDGFFRRDGETERLEPHRPLPVLPLEHVASGYGRLSHSDQLRSHDLLDCGVLLDYGLRLGILAELQVGVLHEIVRVRNAGERAVSLLFSAYSLATAREARLGAIEASHIPTIE